MGASSISVRLRDVVVVGGGCYGTFYAGQLLRARERGAADWRRLLIVDRDPRCRAAGDIRQAPATELVVAEWGAFFDEYFAGASAQDPACPDAIVPVAAHAPPHVRVAPAAGPIPLAGPGRSSPGPC